MGRDRGEGNATLLRLFGIDVALEWPPAAAGIERHIVRLAEQQREIDRALARQRPKGGVERDAGIAAASLVFGGGDPADAADAHGPSVPRHVMAEDPDMA